MSKHIQAYYNVNDSSQTKKTCSCLCSLLTSLLPLNLVVVPMASCLPIPLEAHLSRVSYTVYRVAGQLQSPIHILILPRDPVDNHRELTNLPYTYD